jgi:hypothetical protein
VFRVLVLLEEAAVVVVVEVIVNVYTLWYQFSCDKTIGKKRPKRKPKQDLHGYGEN